MAKLHEPVLEPILNGSVTPDEAITEARQHLQAEEADPRWCIPWAFVLWRLEKYQEAYEIANRYHSALQNDSNYLLLLGIIARKIPDKVVEAEAALQASIRLEPGRGDAFYNLGNLYLDQDRLAEAIDQYCLSLERNPESDLTWLNLGNAARSSDQLQLSFSALKQCLKLNPQSIRAWCNFGITCHQLEFFDSATQAYKLALGLDKEHGPSLVNLALNLNASNRHPEAVEYLQAASSLTLQEDSGDALFNLALTRLLLGEFAQGWKLYECRFKTRQYEAYFRIPCGPWIQDSQSLATLASQGGELLVWSEQGMGDVIQFSRYLYLLQAMGLRPVLATRPALVRLFKEWLQPGFPVIDDLRVDISADQRSHTAILSLPHLFGTTLETVPASLPYFVAPGSPPEALLVPPAPGGLSIGLVWASNPDNKMMYHRKSLPLAELLEPLLPALREDLFELHSLQVGDDATELNSYANHPNIVNWNGRLSDFADTAHVIRQLDLVISVDTAVAHLAGALGVRTWLMLHYDADFRWLRNCDDSPWYPNMKLIRQQKYGDWSTVIHPIIDELGRIYGLNLLELQ